MRAGLIVIVASIAGCAASPPCTRRYVPTGTVQPFMWQVTGPRGGVVLLGTLHTASDDDVPDEARLLLAQSDVFVAEAAEVNRSDRLDGGTFAALPGQSLMQTLSASDFADLQRHLDLDADELARLKPWVALGLLMKTRFEFPEENISAALLADAQWRHIPVEFFDTWNEQVAFLDQTVDAADVRGALHDYPNIGCMLTGQLEAYRAGDDDAFRVDEPALIDPGAVRVAKWSLRIVDYLDSGQSAFIAIGVGNILGATGIAADLQSRGYVVTRFPAHLGR